MAKVTLPDSFSGFTGGVREYETHVTVYRDLEVELKEDILPKIMNLHQISVLLQQKML